MGSPGKRTTGPKPKGSSQVSMFATMTMMMVCCLGIFLLVAIMPVIGWPAGVTLAVAGGAALMYVHQKMMKHDCHH